MGAATKGGVVPLKEGLFVIPDAPGGRPQLLGVECPSCHARFATKRVVCLECGHRGTNECRLSPFGTVHTFTIIHQTPKGSVMEAPYAIAQVHLDDGPIVSTAIADVTNVRVGLPVEMALHDIKKDEEGRRVVAYVFRPRREAP
jgi:uncharacterized OB-fold protein